MEMDKRPHKERYDSGLKTRTEVLGRFSTGWLSHDMTVGLSQSERYSVSYDLQTITLPQK